MEFRSTYSIFVLTQNPLGLTDDKFDFKYYVIDTTEEKAPPPQYSLTITIAIGIPLMIITLCVLEGKSIFKWLSRKI